MREWHYPTGRRAQNILRMSPRIRPRYNSVPTRREVLASKVAFAETPIPPNACVPVTRLVVTELADYQPSHVRGSYRALNIVITPRVCAEDVLDIIRMNPHAYVAELMIQDYAGDSDDAARLMKGLPKSLQKLVIYHDGKNMSDVDIRIRPTRGLVMLRCGLQPAYRRRKYRVYIRAMQHCRNTLEKSTLVCMLPCSLQEKMYALLGIWHYAPTHVSVESFTDIVTGYVNCTNASDEFARHLLFVLQTPYSRRRYGENTRAYATALYRLTQSLCRNAPDFPSFYPCSVWGRNDASGCRIRSGTVIFMRNGGRRVRRSVRQQVVLAYLFPRGGFGQTEPKKRLHMSDENYALLVRILQRENKWRSVMRLPPKRRQLPYKRLFSLLEALRDNNLSVPASLVFNLVGSLAWLQAQFRRASLH